MQTVNFPCGHCGNLMGVGSEFLGQPVRCPHCQQVVVAPPTAPSVPAPPPAPADAMPSGPIETVLQPPAPLGDAEDIFTPTEASDDLFGRPEPPRIEIRTDLPAPTVPGNDAVRPPEPAADTTPASTVPFPPPGAEPPSLVNGESTATLPIPGPEAHQTAGTLIETSSPLSAQAPASVTTEPLPPVLAPSISRPARRAERGPPWFMLLVFSPLVLYAIVITVFAALFYLELRRMDQERRNPFEIMPDDGDNPGIQKGKKTTQQTYHYDPKLATMPLPANLRTSLNKPLRIGDVQITPTSVERKQVNVFVEGSEKAEPCLGDSLVLHLTMKNLSSEYAFAPLDNYFDRCWKPGNDMRPPFTQLEIGELYRCYGGPARWYPRSDKENKREWVEGRKASAPDLLQPSEEREFFVCTDGNDSRATLVLFGENKGEKVRQPYHGPFLWRVRVRRGLVRVKNKDHSATAVVGVEFTDKDIH